jgi:hypothetical protein
VPALSWQVFRRTSKLLVKQLGGQFESSMTLLVDSLSAKQKTAARPRRSQTS